MKAFVKVVPSSLSQGIHRVARALALNAPRGVIIVNNADEADVIVVHVIGHGSFDGWTFRDDQKVGILQYCLLTTENPTPAAWLPWWERAKVVWSYYDLAGYVADRGRAWPGQTTFLHAPLGVDPVFQPEQPLRKLFMVGTSGYVADTEGVNECSLAVRALNEHQLHLGPRLPLKGNVTYISGVTDEQLAQMWSRCRFVAGLRRIEGFELPALEGLMCGARPVMFDAPHYRRWFDGFAEFVLEESPEQVTQSLLELFSKPYRAVTEEERSHAAALFDWTRITSMFWEAML